jgi:glycosyltransferase involved in cell wall biosynthesis
MAEAQAAGCPVIAYARGAAGEIIREGKTGMLFREATVESLFAAVESFESRVVSFRPKDATENAVRFGKTRFQDEFRQMVNSQWKGFTKRMSRTKA